MVKGFFWRVGLAIATPLLIGLYAYKPTLAPINLWLLLPWIFLLESKDRKLRLGLWIFACWLTQLMMGPQLFKFAWYFPLARGLIYLWPWLAFPLMFHGIRRLWPRGPLTWIVPLCWTATEYLRITFSLANFDIYALGYSQVSFSPIVQIADVLGVYGVSFLVAMTNGFLADVILFLRNRSQTQASTVRLLPSALSLLILGTIYWGYGAWKLSAIQLAKGPRVTIIQPNLKHSAADAIGVHLEQLWMTETRVEPNESDLLVWPENAILDNLERPGAYLPDLAWLSERKGAPILVGSMGKSETQPGYTTNTAFLVNQQGEILGSYDKQLLFPWSEFVPWDATLQKFAPPLARLHRRLIRMGWGFMPPGEKGTETKLLPYQHEGQSLPFGALICVENTYPPIPAAAARAGARFLVNITSEGEVGGPVQAQLLKISALRAVETRLAYVRVGNSGISTFIDPLGRTQSILVGDNGRLIFDRGTLTYPVALSEEGVTLYARSRDAFAKIILFLSLALAILGYSRGRFKHRLRASKSTITLVVISSSIFMIGCGGLSVPSLNTNEAQAEVAKVREHQARGEWSEVIQTGTKACGDESSCQSVISALRMAFVQSGAPENGVLFFQHLAERYPNLEGEALTAAAFCLEKAIKLNASAELYEKVITNHPSSFAYLQYANLLMRMDQPEAAAEIFQQGIQFDPSSRDLRYFYARNLRIRGLLQEAKTELEQLLIEHPDYANGWVNLARVYLELGDRPAAVGAFDKTLQLDSEHIEARWQQAKLAMQEEDLETASRLILEIRRIESGLPVR